ncbi:unnamed protein product [Cuscuta epithymum]|uniref:Uncharacterized protein n=1 Tax=Cuscuta epithymum TaxID=186058 RepID=A0AAV0GEM6_9ASTE|nr:unnamed protein product [Cuscuta epithymum]
MQLQNMSSIKRPSRRNWSSPALGANQLHPIKGILGCLQSLITCPQERANSLSRAKHAKSQCNPRSACLRRTSTPAFSAEKKIPSANDSEPSIFSTQGMAWNIYCKQ